MPPAAQAQFFVQVERLSSRALLDLTADLLECTVESSLHLPDVASLVLHDTDLRWVDADALEPGRGLKISATGARGERQIFDGEIVELEPEFDASAQRLTVRAFDRLHRLGRGRQVRSFVNVTDGDVVRRLAREARLDADVGAPGEVQPYLLQHNETNLDFLRRRASAVGRRLYVEGEKLVFAEPAADSSAVPLRWGETLATFRPRMTTASQVASVTVRSWDPHSCRAVVGRAPSGPPPDVAERPAVGEARDGGAVAEGAFGVPTAVLVADRPVRTQDAADRLARATLERHLARFIEAEGACAGESELTAGALVEVQGVGRRFGGRYLVTTVRHVYTPREGYVTHFGVTGPNAPTLAALLAHDGGDGGAGHGAGAGGGTGGAGARGPGLVVGVVTDVGDPDGRGRVKVRYPWLSEEHGSDWARVVSAGAGDGRGAAVLPEVNDEVLVGFEQGDMHHAYVLGGLWNGDAAPPEGHGGKLVEGGKVQRRVLRSRAGHTVTLDDADGGGGVTVEDRNGNTLALDSARNALTVSVKGDVSVGADGALALEAKGRVTIRGAGVTVDGGAGTVDVRGQLIDLN